MHQSENKTGGKKNKSGNEAEIKASISVLGLLQFIQLKDRSSAGFQEVFPKAGIYHQTFNQDQRRIQIEYQTLFFTSCCVDVST